MSLDQVRVDEPCEPNSIDFLKWQVQAASFGARA